MFENNLPRMIEWHEGEDFEHAKKAILSILKDEKVSLSKIRSLFSSILNTIEDENPITL